MNKANATKNATVEYTEFQANQKGAGAWYVPSILVQYTPMSLLYTATFCSNKKVK